jgi:hypothetical protein
VLGVAKRAALHGGVSSNHSPRGGSIQTANTSWAHLEAADQVRWRQANLGAIAWISASAIVRLLATGQRPDSTRSHPNPPHRSSYASVEAGERRRVAGVGLPKNNRPLPMATIGSPPPAGISGQWSPCWGRSAGQIHANIQAEVPADRPQPPCLRTPCRMPLWRQANGEQQTVDCCGSRESYDFLT